MMDINLTEQEKEFVVQFLCYSKTAETLDAVSAGGHTFVFLSGTPMYLRTFMNIFLTNIMPLEFMNNINKHVKDVNNLINYFGVECPTFTDRFFTKKLRKISKELNLNTNQEILGFLSERIANNIQDI